MFSGSSNISPITPWSTDYASYPLSSDTRPPPPKETSQALHVTMARAPAIRTAVITPQMADSSFSNNMPSLQTSEENKWLLQRLLSTEATCKEILYKIRMSIKQYYVSLGNLPSPHDSTPAPPSNNSTPTPPSNNSTPAPPSNDSTPAPPSNDSTPAPPSYPLSPLKTSPNRTRSTSLQNDDDGGSSFPKSGSIIKKDGSNRSSKITSHESDPPLSLSGSIESNIYMSQAPSLKHHNSDEVCLPPVYPKQDPNLLPTSVQTCHSSPIYLHNKPTSLTSVEIPVTVLSEIVHSLQNIIDLQATLPLKIEKLPHTYNHHTSTVANGIHDREKEEVCQGGGNNTYIKNDRQLPSPRYVSQNTPAVDALITEAVLKRDDYWRERSQEEAEIQQKVVEARVRQSVEKRFRGVIEEEKAKRRTANAEVNQMKQEIVTKDRERGELEDKCRELETEIESGKLIIQQFSQLMKDKASSICQYCRRSGTLPPKSLK